MATTEKPVPLPSLYAKKKFDFIKDKEGGIILV